MPTARALVVEPGLLDDQPLDLALALDRDRLGEEIEHGSSWPCPAASAANSRRWVTDLRWPGLEQGVVEHGREIGRDRPAAPHPRDGRARPAPWASSRSGAARAGRARGCRGSRCCRARRRRGRRCPSRRTRPASWRGCGRRRARHCRCRSPPPRRRRAADRDRRIRDGRYTSRRRPPSRPRRAGRRRGCRAAGRAGAPVARITAS